MTGRFFTISGTRNPAQAIREFVENNEWQIAEIRTALKEADAGDFASDKEVARLTSQPSP